MSMPMKAFRRDSGFSLIEVLVAVVILATGLLALTALQGRLAQASADAKVRSRIASLLTSRMDELRAAQYASIRPIATSATDSTTSTCANGDTWVCIAQNESSVSDLSVGHQYERFVAFSVTPAVAVQTLSTAEFKRITLTAIWTDAAGVGRRLAMSTDVSPLSLTSNRIPSAPGGAGSSESAIVRQDNPAGPGVIPIAIGGGDATAASNPRPEIIGKGTNASTVGTRFDVLTYNGLSGASVIQRRVETAAIDCTCQYGAGGTNLGTIYQTAQWPAEWTGERYEVIAPSGATAPGDNPAIKSGPASGEEQSPLCTECCRDHHDAAGSTTNKFDPVRSGNHDHYGAANLVTPVGTSAGTRYIEACRLVRVDGFWRTASDLYAKHFGLINTSAFAGVPAKSGAPDLTAVSNYQGFVKSYLSGYLTSPTTIANATDGGQVPNSSVISINKPPPADERYLHARGLYVDFLNQKAQDRITKALLPANCPGIDKTECILSYLPFTTINTTELSYWEPQVSGATDTVNLDVATGSSLIFDPLQPTRGRTNARSSASNGANSEAVASITRSNAGVAVAQPVDPQDDAAEGIDRQRFNVVASATPTVGQSFSVRLTGLPQTSDTNTSNDPALAWTNLTGSANCNATLSSKRDLNPNDYLCATYGTLGIPTSVRISNYFREYTVSQTMTATCGVQSATAVVARPTFSNFAVSSTTGGGVATAVVTNDAKTSESTLVSFTSVPANGLVEATFTLSATLQATIASCTTNVSGSQINNIVWTKSWLTP